MAWWKRALLCVAQMFMLLVGSLNPLRVHARTPVAPQHGSLSLHRVEARRGGWARGYGKMKDALDSKNKCPTP
jgi:hypothetical protein